MGNTSQFSDLDFNSMGRAIELAHEAQAKFNEVPIGCVIVKGGQIIGEGLNLKESSSKPTAHAEIMAIEQASQILKNWRLLDCTLYVTCEPCAMCAGAILQARIPRVVFAVSEPKFGCAGSLYNLLTDHRFNHRAAVESGLRHTECANLLQNFFEKRRANNSDKKRG